MPSYPIIVELDPTKAAAGAQVIETKLEGVRTKATAVNTSLQRAFDFDAKPATAAASSVDRALEGVRSTSEAAAAAVTRASSSVGILGASSIKAANDMRAINDRLTQLLATSDNVPKVNQRIANSQAQVRASTISLGAQFNDFSTQVLAGGSVITAFAQQSGQAAFALQGMNGWLGTVGRFLAGPWGTVLIIATTVLAGFVSKMFESADATNKASDALKKFEQHQADIANFIDATTGKLKEQNRTLLANAALLRQKTIAENAATVKKLSDDAFSLARNTRSGPQVQSLGAREGVTRQNLDPEVLSIVRNAGGDVIKLDAGLRALNARRPELIETTRAVSDAAARAALLTRENQKLGAEVDQLTGKTNGQTFATSAIIERQVALATATTGVEKAHARLNDVRARGSEIDKITDPKARSTALEQYRKDLTSATVAVNNATAAQKAARAATAEHNKELRAQQAELKKQQALAERVRDFIDKLKDQADALDLRGVDSAITTQLDAFYRQFNRGPSTEERAQIETAVRRIQLLGDEKVQLDAIRGPLEAYQRSIAALTDLLSRGKISQDEFNQALADLPLQQALDAVDKSLTGTLIEYDAQLKAINATIDKAIATVDRAEKAGILNPEEAEKRRVALRGPKDANGDITVNGGPTNNLRDQSIHDLNRQRQEPLRQLDASLTRRPDLQRNAQIGGINNEKEDKLKTLRDSFTEEERITKEYLDRKVAIEQEAADKIKALDDATTQTRLAAGQSAADALLGVAEAYAGKQSGIYKGLFIVSKGFAIAQAVLALQQNIAEASKYGFPQNIPFIAQAIVQGSSILTNIQGIAAQFRDGGYTGDKGEDEVAGVVHGKEFVMPAAQTRQNRAVLEAMKAGTFNRSQARAAANDRGSQQRPFNLNIDATKAPGVEFEQTGLTEDAVYMIARRAVASDTPKIVANQIRNPNSRVSKSLGSATTTQRKRG